MTEIKVGAHFKEFGNTVTHFVNIDHVQLE